MSQVVLRATDVTKAYAGVQALKRASLELRAGEVHALVGENGAGKSTLIKILTGYTKPDAGSIFIGGEPVSLRSVDHARTPLPDDRPPLYGDGHASERIAESLYTLVAR